MVLRCNQSSDVLVISKAIVAALFPLQSDFSPREVWNFSDNVKPHIKVSKSNFLTAVKLQQVEKKLLSSTWKYVDSSDSYLLFTFCDQHTPCVSCSVLHCVGAICCSFHHKDFALLVFYPYCWAYRTSPFSFHTTAFKHPWSLLICYPFSISVYIYGSQRAFPFPWGNCPTSIYFPVLQVIRSLG